MSTEVAGFSLKQVLEAVLFSSQRPVPLKDLQGILKSAAEAEKQEANVVALSRLKESDLRAALNELGADCRDPSRAYELRETASGWQLVTKAGFAPWLRQLFPEYRSARLSSPALETLAIIAYRQPITRADIEAVRGVAVDGVVQTLLDRGLIKIAGRAEVPGRPLLYETTQHFMDHFGLRNLDELPNSAELRRMHLPAAAPGGAEVAQMELPADQSAEGTHQQDADSFKKLPIEEQS